MKYGLGLNANETVEEVVEKAVEAEKLGFDYVWISDLPSQRYAPVLAVAVAENTKRIRIGLGLLSPLLHKPFQIAGSVIDLVELYGERFELCIGPGDMDQLRRVGAIPYPRKAIPSLLLKARNEIIKELLRRRLTVKLWLGAQGPNVLRLARFFDGILLNYSSPEMVEWAIVETGLSERDEVEIGVYTPSYVYRERNEEAHLLLKVSSAIVALGASKPVLRKLGCYEVIANVKEKLKQGLTPEELLKYIPGEVLEKFGVSMYVDSLPSYISALSRKGVKQIVFGYPQNLSLKTIRSLSEGIKLR